MNYIQLILFLIYAAALFIAGLAIYLFMNKDNKAYLNRSVFLGESLLLGSILVVGEMMVLSLIGLYKTFFLWGIVFLNYGFLWYPTVRKQLLDLLRPKSSGRLSTGLFISLLLIFIFRNCFFLVDVDSHSTYLFAQKLWLAKGSSLVGDVATDIRIFSPHFNAVPYALGLSAFREDTLFAQLVVVSWSVIALLLLFGYISYRFNPYYALSGVMLVLFNDHFFYSGANNCCIINSALISFVFAAGYNFWESYRREDPFRLVLALIFLCQLMANKYQMTYTFLFVLVLGVSIQSSWPGKIRLILGNKPWFLCIISAVFLVSLWYLKNFLVTGIPTFPILAGKYRVFNWTPEMSGTFYKIYGGGLSFPKFLKYFSYLFVWPGVHVAKYVLVCILFFPFILMGQFKRAEINRAELFELGYWLGLSILMIMGLCLVNFVDPRHYRYGIGIFAFTLIFVVDYICRSCFGLKSRWIPGVGLFLVALTGYHTIFMQGGAYKRPTFQDNINVILNKLHFEDVWIRYFPKNAMAREGFAAQPEKIKNSAWDTGIAGVTPLSAFLLPIRPQVGLWHTSVVKWDSYKSPDLIAKDLESSGLKWIMRVQDDRLVFLSVKEYAQEAAGYDRFPQSLFYDYGFPKELSEIKY